MTLMRHFTNKRVLRAVLPLAGLGAVAAALSGCGGATTNTGGAAAPTLASGPVIYGVNAAAASSGAVTQGETSGLIFTPSGGAAEAIAVGATGYHTTAGAGPLPVYQQTYPNSGATTAGLPFGFGPGGAYYNDPASTVIYALPTNVAGTLVFGAYASSGTFNNTPSDINPASIVLTSSESPSFSQPLTFIGQTAIGTGLLSQAEYETAAFPVPAFLQTTGLHNLHTAIADVNGQSSTTDFSVLSLAPTDSAALVTISYTSAGNTAVVAGATATITNALPTVAAYKDPSAPTGTAALPLTTSYSDGQGVVILFAPPGAQTVTINGISPFDGKTAITGTATLTLAAGAVNTSGTIAATAGTTPATAAAIANAKRSQRHIQH